MRVCLLLHDDKINRDSRIDWEALSAAGIALHWHTPQSGTMHHKFCVVDKKVTLFGTYNWTFAAANWNKESLMVIENEDTAQDFRAELAALLQDAATQKHTTTTATYAFSQDLSVHPQLGQMRAEIQLLEIEITHLEAACLHYERLIAQYTAKLQVAVADLLLEHLELKRLMAEAQAERTQKKTYYEEAKKWQNTAEQTRESIHNARQSPPPQIDVETAELMSRLYRETLMKIHPDRYENDPEKRDIVTQLTQKLVEAYKKSDFETVRRIWEEVQKGWIFVEDLLKSSDWDAIFALVQRLRTKRQQLEQDLTNLREDSLVKAVEDYPNFEDYIEISRQQLTMNIQQLKKNLNDYKK